MLNVHEEIGISAPAGRRRLSFNIEHSTFSIQHLLCRRENVLFLIWSRPPHTMPNRPFLILIVLDGFGCRKETESNAIAEADTPRFDRLFRESAWTAVDASGAAVGLPRGQMGNSEVGHLNIGAGRVVDQDIVRIGKAVS